MKAEFKRWLVAVKKSTSSRSAHIYYQFGAFVGLWFVSIKVFADGKDFSLDNLDSSIQTHATGDFGKLCFGVAFVWVLANVAIGKLGWKMIMTPAVLLMAVAFYPTISNSIFG